MNSKNLQFPKTNPTLKTDPYQIQVQYLYTKLQPTFSLLYAAKYMPLNKTQSNPSKINSTLQSFKEITAAEANATQLTSTIVNIYQI